MQLNGTTVNTVSTIAAATGIIVFLWSINDKIGDVDNKVVEVEQKVTSLSADVTELKSRVTRIENIFITPEFAHTILERNTEN